MHKEVEKVYDLIHLSKVTLVSSLQKLESNGMLAKFELREEDRTTDFTQQVLVFSNSTSSCLSKDFILDISYSLNVCRIL